MSDKQEGSDLPTAIVLPVEKCSGEPHYSNDYLSEWDFWVALDWVNGQSKLNTKEQTGKLRNITGYNLTGGFGIQLFQGGERIKTSIGYHADISAGAVGTQYEAAEFNPRNFYTFKKGKNKTVGIFRMRSSGAQVLFHFLKNRVGLGANLMGWDVNINQNVSGRLMNFHLVGVRAQIIAINRNRLQLGITGGVDATMTSGVTPTQGFYQQLDKDQAQIISDEGYQSGMATAIAQIHLAAEGLAFRHIAQFYYRKAASATQDYEKIDSEEVQKETLSPKDITGTYWNAGLEWKILPGNRLISKVRPFGGNMIPFISFFSEAGQNFANPGLFPSNEGTPLGSKNIVFGLRVGGHWTRRY
tara:strand:- start:10311 stop:11381 length:1071 start_codon:yes stop_codon:yes gene_type:complete